MGEWYGSKEAKSSIFIDTVTSASGPIYHIFMHDDLNITFGEKSFNNKFWLFGRLIKLNNDYFLDTWFDVNHLNADTTNHILANNEADDYDPVLFPGHFIFKLKMIDKNNLQYSYFDVTNILKMINNKKLNLNYTKIKRGPDKEAETIILIDNSKRLQEILKQSNNLGLFIKKNNILIKKSDEPIYRYPQIDPN